MTVAFDYALWAARYPELAISVSPVLASAYFDEAGSYLSNADNSVVSDVPTRLRLLNMLVAHIAALNAPLNGQASAAGVGRVANASEGSVSVQLEYGTPSNNAAWFNQTKYGAAWWAATASLRTMRYVAACQPRFDRYGPWR